MTFSLVDDGDTLERQNQKLRRIADVLMRRVEQETNASNQSYAQFQATIALEAQVRARTGDLAEALEHLNTANAELVRAKAEAERARNDLSDALEAVREGFALFDANDRLVMKNSRFCADIPDVSRRIQPGMDFADYVALVARSRHLALRAEAERTDWLRKRMDSHKRRHADFVVEIEGDRWIQVSEQRTAGNGTAIIQTDVTDIVKTERMEAGRQLDDQARLIRATLDHVKEGVAIFDRDNRLLRANSRLTEILSPPVQLLRRGTSFDAIADYFRSKRFFSETDDLARLMQWVARPFGALTLHLATVDDQFFDLYAERIPAQGFVISLNDVSIERRAARELQVMNQTLESRVADRTAALKAAHDEAEAANVSKSQFVAAVTHDLLQPMNAAKLFLASLAEYDVDEAPRRLIRNVANAFEGAEAILGALVDITRLERGDVDLQPTAVPLRPVLETLNSEFAPVAAAKGLDFRVAAPDIPVVSDRTYLRRILQNLIGNAIRYTTSGSVDVCTEIGDGTVRIDVRDTGPGIPGDQQREVFKEFRKLRPGHVESGSMGLGLAIVDRACKLLGHQLELRSGEDEGACFSVWLPVATGAAALAVSGENLEADGSLAGLVVLVVENVPETLNAMTGLMEQWGIHSIEASGAQQALDLLDEIGIVPDAILADYHLDEPATGLDLISEIRNTFGPVPSCLVTANYGVDVDLNARRHGAEVLRKPLAPHQLRSFLTWAQRSRGSG